MKTEGDWKNRRLKPTSPKNEGYQMADKPGYYKGRYLVTYDGDVEKLKRKGNLKGAEALLLQLVAATEAESKATGGGVVPWYYEELAKIYRKREDRKSEIAILERFAKKKHAPGVESQILIDRLQRVKQVKG